MRPAITVALALAGVALTAGVARAYPQYQLTHEQTCASCHISPAGGGLLSEMGELTAEDESQWGGKPTFLHGLFELPEWLRAGGDIRVAGGEHNRGPGTSLFAIIPMQFEVYAAASHGPITAYATAGITSVDKSTPGALFREHWLMWKPKDGGEGLYVRAGRFIPVYGLRQPEHVYYTRRFGGTPLYSEAYGLTVGWLSPGAEIHATAFVHDRVQQPVEKGDGFALYAEKRFGVRAAAGAEARYAISSDESRMQGGLTGKLWLYDQKLLVQGEAQLVRQNFFADAPNRFQVIGELAATYFVKSGLFVDLGLGHFDEDIDVPKVNRDAVDLNIHFFAISHLELLLTSRLQMIGFGHGGSTSGYSLLQVHYRI